MKQAEVKSRQIQILAQCIGVIALILFGRMTGDNGIAYFAAAVESIFFVFLFLGENVPETLGRMLRGRQKKGQFRNVVRVRRNIFLFQFIVGGLGSVLVFVLADVIAGRLFGMSYCAPLIRLLAPVLFLKILSGIFMGWFWGNGNQMPIASAVVIRQVSWLGFGLLFVNLCKAYGEKVSGLLRNEIFTSLYGAAGMVIGMLVSEFLVLVILGLVFWRSNKNSNKQDGLKETEGLVTSVGILYRGMAGMIVRDMWIKLPVLMGMFLYQKAAYDASLSTAGGSAAVYAATAYGTYYGKYLVICALPVLVLYAGLQTVCVKTVSSMRREEHSHARKVFEAGFHIGLVRSLFAAVVLAVLSQQIAKAFFVGNEEVTSSLLLGGSTLVIFAVLALYFIRILLFSGKSRAVSCLLGIYCLLSVGVTGLLLFAGKMGIGSLVYGGLAGSVVLCVLAGGMNFGRLRIMPEWIPHLVVPAAAGGVSGLIMMLLAKLLTPHLGNMAAFGVCFLLGLMVYWVLLIVLRSFRQEELEWIPGGGAIRAVAQILKVL